MKPLFARTAISLALMFCLTAVPAIVRAQGPGGPPHPPGTPGGGAPGLPSPSAGSPANAPSARAHDPAPMHGNAHSSTQFGPAGRWWDDKSVIRAIGITRDQQHRMDDIFNSNKEAIKSSYKLYLKEQAHLESVNKNPNADQATTFAAIDAVNKARAELQKAYAQTLIGIRHEMSQDQIDKLEKLP